jgi:hypothetical protein
VYAVSLRAAERLEPDVQHKIKRVKFDRWMNRTGRNPRDASIR